VSYTRSSHRDDDAFAVTLISSNSRPNMEFVLRFCPIKSFARRPQMTSQCFDRFFSELSCTCVASCHVPYVMLSQQSPSTSQDTFSLINVHIYGLICKQRLHVWQGMVGRVRLGRGLIFTSTHHYLYTAIDLNSTTKYYVTNMPRFSPLPFTSVGEQDFSKPPCTHAYRNNDQAYYLDFIIMSYINVYIMSYITFNTNYKIYLITLFWKLHSKFTPHQSKKRIPDFSMEEYFG
jgi:hypothetical protein